MLTKLGQKLASLTYLEADAIANSVLDKLRSAEYDHQMSHHPLKTPNLKNNTKFQKQFAAHVPNEALKTYNEMQRKKVGV